MRRVPKRVRTAKKAPEASAWLDALRASTEDLIAAAEDAVRPLAERELGRVEHVRIIAESATSIREHLAHLPTGIAS